MKNIGYLSSSTDLVEKVLFLMGGSCSGETYMRLIEDGCALDVRETSQLREVVMDGACSDRKGTLGDLNMRMDKRIDGCAKFFPNGIEWAYLRDLFVVPGETEEQVEEVMDGGTFTADGYLNWPDMPWTWEDLTSSDEDFLRALYLKNGDSFLSLRKLPDSTPKAVRAVHAFLNGEEKAAMLVDCGKTALFRFVSFLDALPDSDAAKLGKIQLFCDENASPTWRQLRRCVIVPVEYINESLTAEMCGKYASTGAVLPAAGDNTLTLAARLPKENTLALFTDPDLAKDIPTSVVLEDVAHSVASDVLKHEALGAQMQPRIKTIVDERLDGLLSEAIRVTGARLSDEERKDFLREYVVTNPYPIP